MGEQVDARILWGCSSVGRAPALQAGGHEFESHHLHASIKPCMLISSHKKSEIKAFGLIAQPVRAHA